MKYDPNLMRRAFELAMESEANGNLPIGALITDGLHVLSEGHNGVLKPTFHPGKHAEIDALSSLRSEDVIRLNELGLYTTLEPCIMCLGSAVLHRVKFIFFAVEDTDRGASYVMPGISVRYPQRYLPTILGPMAPEEGRVLFERATSIYRKVRPAV